MAMARAQVLRQRAGLVQARAGSYRAADTTRSRLPNWFGGDGDVHADHRRRQIIREMARHLERNCHTWAVLHNRWLDDLGVPQPRFMSSSSDWNKRMMERWRAKAALTRGGWDSRQLLNWDGLCRMTFGSVGRDGDAALVKVANGRLTLVESDAIDSQSRGNQYTQTWTGLTLTREGEITKVWICPRVNGFPQKEKAEAYPAETVVLFAHRQRQTQSRGLPPLVAGLDDFERGDSLLESTVIQAEQAANVYGAIKRVKSEIDKAAQRANGALAPISDAGNALPVNTGASNVDQVPDYVAAARGALLMLYDEQEFAQIKNENPNLNVPPFMTFLLRLHSLGLSYPYEIAFMDMNGNSWSNGKILITLARHGMSRWREQVFNPGVTDVALWQLDRWHDEFEQGEKPAGWDRVEWDWPELPWPDPLKEEQTNELARQNGTTSTRRITRHWQAIQDEIAEEDRNRDRLQIERIVIAQQLCSEANKKDPELRLHWSKIVTLGGANTAPGAYLQASAPAQETSADAPSAGKPVDNADDKQPPA